ncbi:MAG: Gfo/Idh/MocA family oxidoreductase [Alphaproteobacteria bacterium]|nr:Gfo/Idh/MocA family oxidoreductase [Alphaproteobacteria bacterium]
MSSDAVKSRGQRLRVLQAGYGAFGAQHAKGWRGCRSPVDLVIADPSSEARARAAQDHPDARVVDDWRAALKTCDIVDAVAPSTLNAAIAIEAMTAGRDVFIEKPVGRTIEEARAVAAAATRLGRRMQVGFVLRFHPLARRLDAVLRDGRLGRLRWIGGDFLCLKRPRRDAGVVLNDAVHFLDLILWLKGERPSEVQAMTADGLGRGFEDLALSTLRWRDGTLGRLDASCVVAGELPDPYAPPGGWSRKRLEFAGERGRAIADFMTGELVLREARHERDGDTWRQVVAPPTSECFAGDSITPLITAELEAFVAGSPGGATIADGLSVAEVCEAMFRSAREGRAIEVPNA